MDMKQYVQYLIEHDPDVLVDMLNISSEELVEAFTDKVEALKNKEDSDENDVPWD